MVVLARKKMDNEIELTRQDLIEQLIEQIDFLIDACNRFDEGDYKYAKQIASIIRVIIYDTKTSHSILKQLGEKETMLFCSTASFPKNAIFFISMVHPYRNYIKDVQGNNRELNTFLPNLHYGNVKKWVTFNQWFNHNVLISKPNHFSRKDLLLFVTNKDGGAHVDPYIDEFYYNISKGLTSIAFKVDGEFRNGKFSNSNPYINVHFATIRQMAHELILSLRKHFGIRPNYNPSLKKYYNMKGVRAEEFIAAEGMQLEFEV